MTTRRRPLRLSRGRQALAGLRRLDPAHARCPRPGPPLRPSPPRTGSAPALRETRLAVPQLRPVGTMSSSSSHISLKLVPGSPLRAEARSGLRVPCLPDSLATSFASTVSGSSHARRPLQTTPPAASGPRGGWGLLERTAGPPAAQARVGPSLRSGSFYICGRGMSDAVDLGSSWLSQGLRPAWPPTLLHPFASGGSGTASDTSGRAV